MMESRDKRFWNRKVAADDFDVGRQVGGVRVAC